MTTITSSLPPIYSQTVSGPVTASTPITLPASGTYTVVSGVTSLNIYLNGQKLIYSVDYNTSGSGPNYTAFVLTQNIVTGDVLELREERNT